MSMPAHYCNDAVNAWNRMKFIECIFFQNKMWNKQTPELYTLLKE